MGVEQNLNISKIENFKHPRAKVEAKKNKPKDQVEEALVTTLKKLDKLPEDMNSTKKLYMNKFTTLEKVKKSSFVPKNKPFATKINVEGKQGPPQVPNI